MKWLQVMGLMTIPFIYLLYCRLSNELYFQREEERKLKLLKKLRKLIKVKFTRPITEIKPGKVLTYQEDYLAIGYDFLLFVQKEKEITVETAFSEPYYLRYVSSKKLEKYEKALLPELFQEIKQYVNQILIWKQYGSRKTFIRWNDAYIENMDFFILYFECAYEKRMDQLPIYKYVRMVKNALTC